VWNLKSRGIGSRLVCELNQKWAQSANCTSCGKCVQSCPTGALAEKGKAAGEMVKINENVSRLAGRRGAHL
jgi:bidirectional [NiFe] hydrogenase diaphorase subunit